MIRTRPRKPGPPAVTLSEAAGQPKPAGADSAVNDSGACQAGCGLAILSEAWLATRAAASDSEALLRPPSHGRRAIQRHPAGAAAGEIAGPGPGAAPEPESEPGPRSAALPMKLPGRGSAAARTVAAAACD